MSDSNQSDDLKRRLGIDGGGSAAPAASSGSVPPPAVGSNVPPPAFGGSAVPPPAVGSNVPPPALGGSNVPAPFLGRPQLDVAPPPFAAKKKKEKKVRRIVEEVYEDDGPIIDKKAVARRRKIIAISIVVALPAFFGMFYFGKSRQTWALMDRSRADAAKLLTSVTKARPIYEEVQAKSGAALSKAKAGQVDTGFLNYARDVMESRPITNSDVDMLNYAAFDPETVDLGFELMRVTDTLWSDMSNHRGLTKTDLDALQSASKLGVPRTQTRLGVLLIPLDSQTLGANVGVISNPGVNDEGQATYDLQVRPGRRSHAFKTYSNGEFGEKINEWVIPVDPGQTGEGGALEKAQDSHFDLYTDRLSTINKLAGKALQMQGTLAQKLQALSNG